MKILYTLLLIITGSIHVYTQSYTGTIHDAKSGEPIPYAEIYYPKLNTGTTTNLDGIFTLDHYSQKKIHLQISYIGYRTIDTTIQIFPPYIGTFYLQPSHFELQEVVISASTGKLQQTNIVHVDHLKITKLQQGSPLTLAESISNIPGVEQNTTGAGIGKPVIRGLSGNRIVTYAQGIRIENQQWGDEHGLGVGEIGIESVEVIKGPASLLYGSDALGGVLYFIDERYAPHDTYQYTIGTKFLSNTAGTMNDIGFKLHQGRYKWNLFAAYNSNADYKTPKGHRVYNTRFDEKNIKTSFGFNTSNWISNIRYSYLQNNFGITEDANYTTVVNRVFDLPFQTIDNHNVSLENVFFLNHSELKTTLGYTTNYRREYEDNKDNQALGLRLHTTSYNIKWNSPILHDHYSFVIGTQGMLQNNINDGEEVLIPDAKTIDFGLLGVVNVDLDQLQLQGGLRIDNRSINTYNTGQIPAFNQSYKGFSYSVGMVYPWSKSKIRTNLSNGFRAPNTSELLSNGVHEGTNRYEIGRQSLSNEQATQLDLSYDYNNDHLEFSINPFYNYIKNYIYLAPTDYIIAGNPVFEYLQSNAYLYGGEIGVHYHPHDVHWLHLEGNISTTIAEDTDKKPLPLIPQTKLNSTVSIEFLSQNRFRINSFYLQHIYKFNQDRIGIFETSTDAYHLIHLGISAQYDSKHHKIEISGGIKNILNSQYIDHLSRFKPLTIANQGRNIYVGLKYGFNHSIKN